jgi:hypothetical protein
MLFWLTLTLAVVVTLGSAVYATSKGLEAFRAVKQLGQAVDGGIERIATSSASIERQLALAAENGGRLDASLGRVRTSRARLNVLTSAIADVRAAADRLTDVVPRK